MLFAACQDVRPERAARSARWLLAALLAFQAVSGPVRAAGLPLTGRVLDESGRPLAGARIALTRLPSYLERGELLLAGRAYPEPAAETRSGPDGSFRIEAPESGFWSLVVRSAGRAPMEYPLWPLIEGAHLEPVHLPPATTLTVHVTGAGGGPLAGAVVSALGPGPGTPPAEGGRWRPIPRRLARSDEAGTARLPRFAGEPLRLDGVDPALGIGVWNQDVPPGASEVGVVLAPVPGRTLRAVTAGGTPVAGAIVWSAGPLPMARTDAAGEARLALAGGEAVGVQLDGPDGLQAEAEVEPPPADGSDGEPPPADGSDGEPPPVVAVLEPTPERSGLVVEEGTRRAVAGAWVWVPASPAQAARTDRSGSYRLAILPGRKTSALEVAATGYVPTWMDLADPSSQEALPTVALTPAFALGGTVVDGAGKPLSEVAIRVVPDARSHASGLRIMRTEGFARSDAAGRFRIAGLHPQARYRLEAALEGFPRLVRDVPAPDAGSRDDVSMALVMARGPRVVGRVAGPAGEPVAGARVGLRPEAYRSGPFQTAETPELSATTDGEGAFEIADVPAGKAEAVVVASGWASGELRDLDVPGGPGRVDVGVLTLEPEVPIEGRVVDPDGRPIRGARVSARPASNRSGFGPGRSWSPSPEPATTASDGRFRLGGFGAGERVSVDVSAQGYLPLSRPGLRLPAAGPLELRLAPAATIEGRVVDVRGRPVAGAFVGPSSQVWSGGLRTTAKADEDGEFSLSPVAPGVRVIEASADGYVTSSPHSVEVVAGRETPPVEIVLETAAVLAGRVLTADGLPVAGATITARRQAIRQSRQDSATSDGDGHFAFDRLAPGRVTIRAAKEGFTAAEVEAEAGQDGASVELVLGRGVEVSGRLVDEGGEPVAGGEVTLVPSAVSFATPDEPRATTRSDGTFTLSGVADGEYRIGVLDRWRLRYTSPGPVVVEGAAVRGVEVRLPGRAAVRGRLLGLEPDQAAGLTITASSSSNPGAPHPGRVLDGGGYEITDLLPGDWQVRAAVADGGPVATARVTIDPEEPEAEADLRFEPGLTLTGRVVRAGEPVVGATVLVNSLARAMSNSGVTDGDGRFRVTSLGAGRNVVQIQTVGHSESAVREVDLDGDRDVVFELAGHRLAGTVVAADGSGPVEAARVEARLRSHDGFVGGAGNQTVTGGDGRFVLGDLDEGEWRLAIEREGFAEKTVSAVVGPGDVELPAIVLEPAARELDGDRHRPRRTCLVGDGGRAAGRDDGPGAPVARSAAAAPRLPRAAGSVASEAGR